MTLHESPTTRRTVLTTIVAGSTLTHVGCTGTTDPDGTASSDGLDAAVDGTDLVVEFPSTTEASTLAVIDPEGESFADRALTPGTSQERIALGTAYRPGEYSIRLLADDDVVATTTREIRPEIVLTDLKLGRNHPDAMYDGAGDHTVRTETILSIENQGTGPEILTKVEFDGYVPRQTPAESEDSGLVSVNDQPAFHVEPVIKSGESNTLYTRVVPFSSTSQEVECHPDGSSGEMTVSLEGFVSEEKIERTYDVDYTGEDLIDCEITIEEVDQ